MITPISTNRQSRRKNESSIKSPPLRKYSSYLPQGANRLWHPYCSGRHTPSVFYYIITPAHGQPLVRGVFLTDLPGSKNCDIIQIRAYHNCDSRGEANARKTVRKTLNRNRMDRDRKHSSAAACGVRRVLSAVGNNRFIFARRVRRVHRVCAHPHNAARVRSEKVQTLYPALYPDGARYLR